MRDENYGGFPPSTHFKQDSKQLAQATAALRTHVLTNIVRDNPYEIDRITKYFLYWKFYDSQHYREFNDAMLSFNYVETLINKVIMFLLGKKGFTLSVQRYDDEVVSQDFERLVEKLLLTHWNRSKKVITAHEILQMGSVCGDVWVLCEWQKEEKYCKFRTLDSRHCFPMFKDGDYDNLESFIVRIPLEKENTNKYIMRCIRYTNDKIETWYQKTAGLKPSEGDMFEYKEEKNTYGFIPIVHIKNKPYSPGYYSKSDAANILKINKIYNETAQELKAIIDYHATPTTVILGGSSKGLKRGLGKIWSGLPAEAQVFNLGLDVDMSSTREFLQMLKIGMHEMSDVPENALGRLQPVSNTSAAALAITYQPLVQQADLKAVTYGQGFAEMNAMALKMQKKFDSKNPLLVEVLKINPDFEEDSQVVPIFEYGFPQDRMNELNMIMQEMSLGIGSKREGMKRLGKNNVPDLLEEIKRDKLEDALMQAELASVMGFANAENGGESGEDGDDEVGTE